MNQKIELKDLPKAGVIFLVRFNNKFLAGKIKKKILQGLYEFPTSEYVEYQEITEIDEIYKNQVKKWKKKIKFQKILALSVPLNIILVIFN